jgi:RHS repeat-associated protein
MATNTWQSGSMYANRYLNEFTYDANGNILTQVRHNEAGTRVENLSYKYERNANGHLLRNRLYHVNETVAAGTFSDDIDDQGVFSTTNINTSNNYGYDEEGRLIRDDAEDIAQIKWTVTSKVKEVIRTNGSPKKNLKFDYDAFGKRIAKHVYTSANVWESSTYYSYDATGNVMCIYEKKNDGAGITYHAAERFIYGSSRVGVNKERVELSGTVTVPDTGNFIHHIGKKQYELNNHLGNVLSTISDKLIAKDWNNDNTVDSYKAEILSATDYTPFGVAMDGRSYSSGNSRYGFNGVEKLGEYAGDFYITDFRLVDSRLGRWLSIDPIVKEWESGYAAFSNNPIFLSDPSGLDPEEPDPKYKGRFTGMPSSASDFQIGDYFDVNRTQDGVAYNARYQVHQADNGELFFVGTEMTTGDLEGVTIYDSYTPANNASSTSEENHSGSTYTNSLSSETTINSSTIIHYDQFIPPTANGLRITASSKMQFKPTECGKGSNGNYDCAGKNMVNLQVTPSEHTIIPEFVNKYGPMTTQFSPTKGTITYNCKDSNGHKYGLSVAQNGTYTFSQAQALGNGLYMQHSLAITNAQTNIGNLAIVLGSAGIIIAMSEEISIPTLLILAPR